jgi:hypothetical protein
MTFAGLDVHARSTHAAAIDVLTGELVRARFGPCFPDGAGMVQYGIAAGWRQEQKSR